MSQKNAHKKQHIIPQMFQKGFVNSAQNIYMYDSETKKISPRNTESVAYKNHLYTISRNQERNVEVEKKFSLFENENVDFFTKIREQGIEYISEQEAIKIIEFIVFIFIKTERCVEASKHILTEDALLSDMHKIDSQLAPQIIEYFQNTDGALYAYSLDDFYSRWLGVLIENFRCLLLTSQDQAPPFILNDNFCCIEPISKEIHYSGKDVDWRKTKVKLHFPISNKHCVTFVPKPETEKQSEINISKHLVSKSDVCIINNLTYKQKTRYVYCSEKQEIENLIIRSS